MGLWGARRHVRGGGFLRIVFRLICAVGATQWRWARDAALAVSSFCHARATDIDDTFEPRWRRLALALAWPIISGILVAWACGALRFFGG